MAAKETNDPPIIITGGSVTLEYDSGQLPPAGGNKHSNASKKVIHVTVERNGTLILDQPINDGRVVVTVYYRDPNP